MNSTCTIIRKSILALIVGLSVIVLTLSNSFAFTQDIDTINTTLSRPAVAKNGYTYKIFSGTYNSTQDIYYLTSATLSGSADIDIFGGIWSKSSSPYTVTYSVWNAETGSLVSEFGPSNATYNQYQNYYQSRFSSVAASRNEGYYNVLPEGMTDLTNQNNANEKYSNEFINFAPVPADVTQYRSPFSEPVADKHNSYFVVNEYLYWVSYRINTIYELQNSIEGTTETYSGSGEYSEDNSIIYRENSTIQWQNELSPVNSPNSFYGQIANNDNDTFSGILRDLQSSSYGLGVSIGNGTYSYDGKIYVPVSVSSAVYSEPYELCVKTLSNKSLSIDFLRHSSLNTDILVDADVYLSIFKIEDGSYVKSEIKNVQGAYSKIGWTATFDTENTIDSVRMYGPAFVNTAEIPVNLSSILWEYDIDFAQWRDRLESMLANIYQALTGETIETETYTQPSWNDDLNQAEPNSYISQDEMISVFDSGFDDIKPSPENQLSITHWVDMFSVPKLIAACCFALAMGTIILTLGKKKSD